MTYKESDYITEQYSLMTMDSILSSIDDDSYLDSHRERCRIELLKRTYNISL
jgi:hypothetical protein